MTVIPNSNTFENSRVDFYRFHNGEKAPLPFQSAEYEERLKNYAT